MLKLLERTYIAVFRRYPMLVRMALVVLLGEIVLAAVNNFALPFYINRPENLGLPMQMAGTLISAFLVAEMLLKFPAGHLSDRYGRRHFASLGVAACVGTPLAICLVSPEAFRAAPALVYGVLLPLRALDGAGAAALWPPLFASVSDHVPSRERGVAMSVVNSAYLAGVALGPALANTAMKVARVAGRADWTGRAPFAMAVGFALLAAVIAWSLPAAPRRSSVPSDAGAAHLPVSATLPPWRVIFIVIAITFCNMFATGVVAPYIASYLSRVGGVDQTNVGFLILLLVAPAGVLSIPVGHLADRLPKGRVVQVALLVAAVGLWAVPLARTLPQLIGAGMLVIGGFMFGLPAWLAVISDLAPEGGSGKTMGLMATAQGFGAFLGPYLGGRLWDLNARLPFLVAAAALTLSALIALTCLRARRERGVPVAQEVWVSRSGEHDPTAEVLESGQRKADR